MRQDEDGGDAGGSATPSPASRGTTATLVHTFRCKTKFVSVNTCINEFIVFVMASGGAARMIVEGKAGTGAELLVPLPPPHLLSPPPDLPQLRLRIHVLLLWFCSSSAISGSPPLLQLLLLLRVQIRIGLLIQVLVPILPCLTVPVPILSSLSHTLLHGAIG